LNFEVFSDENSIIHRLDPRCKLIIAFLLTFIIALSNNEVSLLLAVVFAVLSIFIARLKLKMVFKRLLVVNIFIGVLWLFLPFTTAGKVIWTLGPLHTTNEGIIRVLLITVKCNTIILILISYIATIPLITLVQALARLRLNKKLVQLLFFSFRYLSVVYMEFNRLHTSAKIRGFRPKTNQHTYKTYSLLIGMLLVRSWERAERVHQAMLCRGFDGNFYSLKSFSIKKMDVMFLIFGILLLLGISWIAISSNLY
jgi:cobalt/nickel transport system permease protein